MKKPDNTKELNNIKQSGDVKQLNSRKRLNNRAYGYFDHNFRSPLCGYIRVRLINL